MQPKKNEQLIKSTSLAVEDNKILVSS